MNNHVHEYERGVHMADAFGIDGRRLACAICGELRPAPTRTPKGHPMTEDQAIGFVALDRIKELITNIRWYERQPNPHYWWDLARDARKELRYLLKLRRTAKRYAAAQPDPMDLFRSFQDWTESEKAGAWGR